MENVTKNIGLVLPEEDDYYNISIPNENMEMIDKAVGDVNSLKETVGATDLSDAITKVFHLGNEKKEQLVSNLIAMGVQADTSETWEVLIGKVLDIMTGASTENDTVTAEVLLEGYTAHGADGNEIVGTMPNNGAIDEIINIGVPYTIPQGYHDGKGTVKTVSLESQTNGTAIAAHIVKDKTAWVNGEKLIGTMPIIDSYTEYTKTSCGEMQKGTGERLASFVLPASGCYVKDGAEMWVNKEAIVYAAINIYNSTELNNSQKYISSTPSATDCLAMQNIGQTKDTAYTNYYGRIPEDGYYRKGTPLLIPVNSDGTIKVS